jgi:hypothetical protein
LAYKWVLLSNTTIVMLLATINSSIILIALDIFRRIHLDPLTPADTNYYSGLGMPAGRLRQRSGMSPEVCDS